MEEGNAAEEAFRARVDRLIARGLRNRWYCIAPSAAVGTTPVAMTRLGEALVVWRDGAGRVHVQEDRCPHRAAPLSCGEVVGDTIACRYHGVRIDGDGVVAQVPALADCHLVGQRLVKAYPVIEHFEGIFAYFGDALHAAPVPFDLPFEMASADWGGFPISAVWQCSYIYAADNLNDPMHTPYLHAATFTHTNTTRTDLVEVKTTPSGFTVGRKEDATSAVEVMEYHDLGGPYWRIDVNYPPGAGPGGSLRILCFVTPVDDARCIINFWRMRKVSGWQRDLWYFMYKALLEEFSWQVLEQDRVVMERMPPWPPEENLYQHDIGVARMRRMVRKEAEAQVRALDAARATAHASA